jgi:ABC-type multidrug transport system fused ATPase/permease subunit
MIKEKKISRIYLSLKKINRLVKYISIKNKKKDTIKLLFLTFLIYLLDIISLASLIPLIILILQKEKAFEYINNFNFFSNFTYSDLILISLFSILLFSLLKFFFLSYGNYYKNFFLAKIQNAFSTLLLSKYLNNSFQFFLTIKISDLIANIKSESERAKTFCAILIDFLLEIVVLFTLLIILLVLSPIASIIFFLFLFLSSYLFLTVIKKHTKSIGEKKSYFYKSVNNHLYHVFKNIKFIKLFSLYSHSINYFNDVDIKEIHQTAKYITISSLPRIYFEFIFITSTLVLILIVLYIFNITDANLIANYLGLYALVGYRILPAVSRVYSYSQQLNFYKNAVDIVYDNFFNINKFLTKKKLVFKNLKKKEVYKIINLSFSFEDNSKTNILKNINLSVNKGDKIGIIGPSGSGKSTIVDVMLGLLNPSSGEILINKSIFSSHKNFYSRLGYVSQDVQLIDGSIKENIIFGNHHNQKNKLEFNNRMIEVSKISNIYNFANKTSDKFNYKIYEDGKNLSMGQKQRILIARSLFKDPDILFMDEPTSALDSMNSINIVKKILKQKYKTIIIVTHHKSLLKYLNKVYEMNNGEIKKIK